GAYPEEFIKSWHDAGEFGKEIGCVIRLASNLEKITLDDTKGGLIIGARPDPIRISAARNELEGFQIVLSPIAGGPRNVSVSVSNLVSDGGKIDKSNITMNAVGYVRIFAASPQEK